jgi:hypothetical protein
VVGAKSHGGWQALEERGVVERACHQWADLVEKAQEAKAVFGDRYQEIRYESLVSETQKTLDGLFEKPSLAPFGEGFYPTSTEDRNYKWQKSDTETFGETIWTDRCAVASEELQYFEIMCEQLERLGYVAEGEAISAEVE